MREIVFIHGRSQQKMDSDALKAEWLAAWEIGLKKSNLSIPPEIKIHFPYYGDTLDQLVAGKSPEDAADIVIRGAKLGDNLELSQQEKAFIETFLLELVEHFEGDAQGAVQQVLSSDVVIEKGVLNWNWVQAILKVLDRHVPGVGSAAVALAARDVFNYLTNPNIRQVIDTGVEQAIPEESDAVIVSHSLGTVVGYNVLRHISNRKVPLFVTLGSPLALNVIKKKLAQIKPIKFPEIVDEWCNALDKRDVVSLYPLSNKHFGLKPPIKNKTNVQNNTPNHHGIAGYLSDKEVAKKIFDAL